MKKLWWLWLVLTPLGCMEVTVRPGDGYGVLDAFQASAGTSRALSPRTLQTLRQLNLEESYREDAAGCFRRLQAECHSGAQADVLFALAEFAYLLAERAEHGSGACVACGYYYHCAGYAYHYLFDRLPATAAGAPDLSESAVTFRSEEIANRFDPRFRLACDLYNAALAHCIRTAQQAGRLDPRRQLHLPTCNGKDFVLTVEHHGFGWGPEEFGPVLLCADYEAVGLPNQHRRYGLGVPLIGTRQAVAAASPQSVYPKAVSFPVSAFFRFEGSLDDLHAQRAGTLEFYNPLEVATVAVRGRPVPLESDLSTPLAYFLSRSDLQGVEYKGFLKPDAVESRAGVYMLEPYQPGKIPVLMIHGLLSSPTTWAPMFNDLRADPELRSRFQFWFYLYPTGPGYMQAAADLRRDLAKLRTDLDPDHKDAALDHMVLVGHSMGGLVSRLLTTDSGDDFWHLVSKKPLADLPVEAAARSELAELFYFDRQAGVERVVFIGTPHRGSKLGASTPAKLVSRFVHLPGDMLKSAHELMLANPADWAVLDKGRVPTSIDLLAPGAPALELLVSRPRPPAVHFHSIIGEAQPRTLIREVTRPIVGNEKTDGVVSYASAHLDDVESEIIVSSDHMHIHHHPQAIREVRRILLEHLRTADLLASGGR